jgi:DNA-binding beta-propeller fold protein YncE
MIRRAALATAALTFCLSGIALIHAQAPRRNVQTPPFRDGAYLNPMGLALSADGRRAFVALNGVNVVAVVDLESGRILSRVETGTHPYEVRRTDATLYIGDDDPEYLILDIPTGKTQRGGSSRLPDGSVRQSAAVEIPLAKELGRFGLHLETEPDWASGHQGRVTGAVFNNSLHATFPYDPFVPIASAKGRFGVLGFGGGFGGLDQSARLSGPIDTGRLGAADPADAAWSASSQMLFVAAAGSDAVLAFPTRPMQAAVTAAANRPAPHPQAGWGVWGGAPAPPVAALLTPVPLILKAQSNPRKIAVSSDGRLLVVSNRLSDSLTVIAADSLGVRVVKHISLDGPPAGPARRGEILFHSNRMTFNSRFTCASCHPGGGSDGRVWDTPDEDPGPRRTKPLFGVADTAPYGWHGDSQTLAARVRKTLTKLHRVTPSPAQVGDLVAYLQSLPAPKAPPVFDEDRAAVASGRGLFEVKARCARCHSGDTFQDGDVHDVGYGGPFRTPSLRGVSERSPLLHDGRAFSIEDIFHRHNEKKHHGAADTLSKDELADLIAFLKTL